MCIVLYISSKHFHLCKFNIHSVLLLYTHSSITLRESLLRARPPVRCLEGCNGELQLWELKNLSGCGDEETEQTDDENLQWKKSNGEQSGENPLYERDRGAAQRKRWRTWVAPLRSEGRGRQEEESSSFYLV